MNLLFTRSPLFKRALVLCLASIPLVAGCAPKPKNDLPALLEGTKAIERGQDRSSVEGTLQLFADSGALEAYFRDSFGCVVFPTVGKGGVGIGGAHGRGWVFRQGRLSGESRMTQVTIGFQLGGQAFSQIIFFEDEAAYNNFTSGNFELSAQASAVALVVGASAQADTAAGATAGAGQNQARRGYTNGMAIFTVVRGGLMYEASVGGQKFSFHPLE